MTFDESRVATSLRATRPWHLLRSERVLATAGAQIQSFTR
jgi:hypothetical protein